MLFDPGIEARGLELRERELGNLTTARTAGPVRARADRPDVLADPLRARHGAQLHLMLALQRDLVRREATKRTVLRDRAGSREEEPRQTDDIARTHDIPAVLPSHEGHEEKQKPRRLRSSRSCSCFVFFRELRGRILRAPRGEPGASQEARLR